MNYIELAKQAGWDAHHAEFDTRIQTFAALVAAHEREECAKVLEAISNAPDMQAYAKAIRARSNT